MVGAVRRQQVERSSIRPDDDSADACRCHVDLRSGAGLALGADDPPASAVGGPALAVCLSGGGVTDVVVERVSVVGDLVGGRLPEP